MARTHRLTRHQIRVRAGRKAARTRARRHGYRKVPRRARARRAVAGDFGMNPRRYHFRRNPRRSGGGMRFGSVRGIKQLAIGAGIGAVGAVGLDYLWQWGSGYLPASLQTGYVGTIAKGAVAVGAGWLAAKAVGRPTAAAAVGGALTVIAYQLFHQMIASASPAAAIPATTTTATPALSGMNAYMMNAYMPHSMGRLGWTSPGTPLRGLGARPGPTAAHWGGGGMQLPTFAAGRPGGSVSASGLASAGTW